MVLRLFEHCRECAEHSKNFYRSLCLIIVHIIDKISNHFISLRRITFCSLKFSSPHFHFLSPHSPHSPTVLCTFDNIFVMDEENGDPQAEQGQNLDIQIFLDREVYFPGDTVSGKVLLNNEEERDMRGIKLTLSCNVNVMWAQKGGQQLNDITYLHKELYIMGEGKQMVLPAGKHKLSFSELLESKNCKDLPTSMEFPNGCARYQVKVELDWPWSYCQDATKTVNVVNIVNLVDHPEALQPASFTNQKRTGSCFNNSIIIVAGRLEKIAYVPGEHLLLNAEINNESGSNIYDSVVRINQIVTYTSTEKKTCTTERVVCEVRKGPLSPGQDLIIEEESLIIPAVPQSARLPSDFLKVAYQVEIGVSLDNNQDTWDFKATQAIFIGTLPTKNGYKRFKPNKSKPSPTEAEWPIDIPNLSIPIFKQAEIGKNAINGGVEESFVMKYPVLEFDREEALRHLESDDESGADECVSNFSL